MRCFAIRAFCYLVLGPVVFALTALYLAGLWAVLTVKTTVASVRGMGDALCGEPVTWDGTLSRETDE